MNLTLSDIFNKDGTEGDLSEQLQKNLSITCNDDDNFKKSVQLEVALFSHHDDSIEYVNYQDETQMPDIMRLIEKDLSEPYSIYTYRYFIHNWPQLCFLVSVHACKF